MEDTKSGFASIYRCAFLASLLMLAIIPVQIAVFAVEPMPAGVLEWFALFNSNPLIGIFHADLFILVNNVLIAVIYLGFYHLLKDTNKGLLQIALLLGFIGIAGYVSSNRTFELLSLSKAYARAASEREKIELAAAGRTMLAVWQGTAFDVYYVLNGITLLVVSSLMFRSDKITKTTAAFGLASGILMMVPSTAGPVGLVFSLLSLAPWYVFTIRYAAVFRTLGWTVPQCVDNAI
jgi:hypothetical protein